MNANVQNIIIEEILGDTLTPISIFQRLKGVKKCLLESSLKHEHSGRYSFIAANPAVELKGSGNNTMLIKKQSSETVLANPLEVLKKIVPNIENDFMKEIPFIGGAAGFVSYDIVRYYEEIGQIPRDEMSVPEVHFLLFETIIVFDHLTQKVFIVGIPISDQSSLEDIKGLVEETKNQILNERENALSPVSISSYEASISKEEFIERVKKAKEYIVEGDIFQVVLSQRMKATIQGDPFSFYRKLRVQNPSPYMYYFDFEEYVVAGASPESLMKAVGETVYTNPIAGTRPRGKTQEEDEQLSVELIQDEKELAEHRMLVDLGRNDLGRVCEFGSVQISKYMDIEKYKHVMHIVSEVKGSLRKEFHPIDALIACLPAGTVSGAPKIRAMEIINELEDVKRGIYSGAVGYYSANGNIDFALAIRTMVVKDSVAYIQAGAGIVYDSIPEKEYEETIHKMKAFLEVEK